MEYSLTVKRLRMKAVLDSIDGGNSPGIIQLRDVNRVVLANLMMTRPSFYLVGADLQLAAPCTGYCELGGEAKVGTIIDGSGNIVMDDMTVGVDVTEDNAHDFEIVLDDILLSVGKQVTIVYATISHG